MEKNVPNVRIELTAFRLLCYVDGLWDERSAYWANRARWQKAEKLHYNHLVFYNESTHQNRPRQKIKNQ